MRTDVIALAIGLIGGSLLEYFKAVVGRRSEYKSLRRAEEAGEIIEMQEQAALLFTLAQDALDERRMAALSQDTHAKLYACQVRTDLLHQRLDDKPLRDLVEPWGQRAYALGATDPVDTADVDGLLADLVKVNERIGDVLRAVRKGCKPPRV